MSEGIKRPVILGLGLGISFIVILVVILNSPPDASTRRPPVEHRYTSLLGDLGDDVLWIRPGESRTFNYTLDQPLDDTGLMTGFIQPIQVNTTGISSVTVKIGNASIPSNYHEFQVSDGDLKQVDFIIPENGSVTFQNTGERVEQIKLNIQLTYFAYRQ
ncbi:MAG: hypothetical protein ACREAZ_07000 [Nitrososphaera sp.]